MELNELDAARLKQARRAAGYSPATASQELVLVLPRSERVSAKKLERIENGTTKTIDVSLLAALCQVYDVNISDIAPGLVEESHVLRDLLISNCRWSQETSIAS